MFETISDIVSTTIIYSMPLVLAGMGGVFSERSGVINIALEGFMVIGAFSAALFTIVTGSAWIGLLCSMLAGLLLAIPFALATISFKSDQVITGISINFLAIGLSMYLVKYLFEGQAQTPTLPDILTVWKIPMLSDLPLIGPTLFSSYPITYLSIVVVIVGSLVINKTVFGLRLKAAGDNPVALVTQGVNVNKIRYVAVLISGVLCGIAGASYSIAIGSEFNQHTIAGQGFIALAAMIFGKWRPYGLLLAASFFGFAVALNLSGQIFGLTRYVPSEFLNMLPYVFTILALIGVVGKATAPLALGKLYEKDSR